MSIAPMTRFFTIWHIVSLVAIRWLATVVAKTWGFQAVSDDDFARVTLAQTFSASPALDPTGTSWLPLPFWIHGTCMRGFGATLSVATTTSLLIACSSSVLLYATARASRISARAAWLGAMLATLIPIGICVGTAPIPELPTAVLCASALLLFRSHHPHAPLVSALFLLPATLCRYEAWIVAFFAALWFVAPAQNLLTLRPAASKKTRWLAVAIVSMGPMAWIIWNGIAHGDPLHFHTRVSSYFFAWSGSNEGGWKELWVYPTSLVFDAPMLTLFVVGAAWWNRQHAKSWLAILIACMGVVATLSLSTLTGGAPTHHPERTLLFVWMVAWMAVATLIVDQKIPLIKRRFPWHILLFSSVIAHQLYRLSLLAPSYGVDRRQELAIGSWLKENTTGPVLLAPKDYGYFAMLSAVQKDRLVLVSSVDPRKTPVQDPFEEENLLLQSIRDHHASWLVAKDEQRDVASKAGERVFELGSWAVLRVRRADLEREGYGVDEPH